MKGERMIAPVYVVGHLNPDTDAIASALGYAWLLRERDGRNAIAARAGAVNPQTAWVLVMGRGEIVEGGEAHATGIRLLQDKYPQYDVMPLEHRLLIVVTPVRVTGWGALGL